MWYNIREKMTKAEIRSWACRWKIIYGTERVI